MKDSLSSIQILTKILNINSTSTLSLNVKVIRVTSSIRRVARSLKKRILTDYMDLIILSLMSNSHEAIGGYDIIRYLHKHFHFLPSPGTVYSQLYSLERKGLIKNVGSERKRTYTLSEKGRKYFQMIQSCREYIQMILNDVIFKNGFKSSQ